jgi:hypothetical protein
MILKPTESTEAEDGRYRGPLPTPTIRAAVCEVRMLVNQSINLRLGPPDRDLTSDELDAIRRRLGYAEGDPTDDNYWK